ncbi:MAG: SUMF1/EgtB/PvdO family nonheme iron enzyme [Acidobacteriota bacterium]|nr:SUMF1/EgtB/PvdO family nonheme iron enzyme [Acidobacteriota bacterium]
MDIFISHNSQDKPLVTPIAEQLDDQDYRVWFDEWNLVPGDPWQEELEKALEQASCVLVFLGNELGPWHHEEVRVALEGRVKGKKRVVPVLLPGVTKPADREIPRFLQRLNWISFRNLRDEDAFHRLRCGIEGIAPGRRRKETTGDDPTPVFHALVLATEKDLGRFRDDTVHYLTNVLNMEAVAGSSEDLPDPASFDLVILIQAWWWEDGILAQAWETVAKDKRMLFIIDENADWPARKLMELPATGDIEAFRAKHPKSTTFDEPKQLQRLIGTAADQYRREKTPEHKERGLSETARAYMEMRLPTWLAGRTGAGKSFTGPDEIYEERFYVSLDGLSSRWTWDEDKGLTTAEKHPEEHPERTAQATLRRPLAWWASRPELPWLLFSGSPGAGKTVFLTRFAAALADHLLGGQTSHEPHLDAAGLGVKGKLPAPVILEATALAARNLEGFNDLVAAVHEELCCTGLTDAPAVERTAKALKAGAYLVLIDALDEIPTEGARNELLCFFKGCHKRLNHLRLIMTTRSARYTGEMAFGPELEVLDLTDLNQNQMKAMCERFRVMKGEPPAFLEKLLDALHGVARCTGADETNLVGNPLLLATACSVFYKLGHLPNDRAALCDRIVVHLCESKVSRFEDENRRAEHKDWALLPEQKRDLLERIALAMQEEKAQEWPVSRVYDVVSKGLSKLARERDRVAQYVKWLVEHTGLLYMQADKQGRGETLRFHHRLFREYLAACRLTKDTRTIKQVLREMRKKGRLIDPNWLDVVRLLPGALNNVDEAGVIGSTLMGMAERHQDQRGRLLAVLAATLVESENLFRLFDIPAFVAKSVGTYETESKDWDHSIRLLFLENIGLLGDPRTNPWDENYWISMEPDTFTMGGRGGEDEHEQTIVNPFSLARFTVTNWEFSRFIEEGGYHERGYWSDEVWEWLHLKDEAYDRWYAARKKEFDELYGFSDPEWFRPDVQPRFWNDARFNNPNQPVVGISWPEAEAYCRWLTEKMKADLPTWWPEKLEPHVTLPTEAEWEYAARGTDKRPYPWKDDAEPNPNLANYSASKLERTTPVGTYPGGATPEGVHDLAGNVWEWCRDVWKRDARESRKRPARNPENTDGDAAVRALRGASRHSDAVFLRASLRDWYRVWSRSDGIGFRCCLCRRPEHG